MFFYYLDLERREDALCVFERREDFLDPER